MSHSVLPSKKMQVMKRLFILLLSLAVCACGKTELAGPSDNSTPNIPAEPEPEPEPEEDIFLQFCIREFDTDGDGEVSQYEADQVRTIDCSGMEIVKLTGIGKFSNLETLDCSNNRLTTLDLSQNRHLASLICTRNALRKVTVAGCKELRTLDCAYNSLSSLDLSSVSALQRVDCSNNSLSTLNVGGCSSLRTLDCSYNSLAALDLSKTAGIVTVTCKRNALASLLLTDCAELVSLDCSYNSLTKLDVKDCRKLSSLNCTDNPYLTELWLWGDQTISDLNKDYHTEIKYYLFEIGDRYSYKDKEGIVFAVSDGGRHGKIVSIDETVCAWSTEKITTGSTDENDGMKNLRTIQAIAGWHEKYPAFAWCADKGEGWYLPTLNELKTLYESGVLELGWYWSSSEEDYDCAWCVSMFSGDTRNRSKDYDSNYVRAVSVF